MAGGTMGVSTFLSHGHDAYILRPIALAWDIGWSPCLLQGRNREDVGSSLSAPQETHWPMMILLVAPLQCSSNQGRE